MISPCYYYLCATAAAAGERVIRRAVHIFRFGRTKLYDIAVTIQLLSSSRRVIFVETQSALPGIHLRRGSQLLCNAIFLCT